MSSVGIFFTTYVMHLIELVFTVDSASCLLWWRTYTEMLTDKRETGFSIFLSEYVASVASYTCIFALFSNSRFSIIGPWRCSFNIKIIIFQTHQDDQRKIKWNLCNTTNMILLWLHRVNVKSYVSLVRLSLIAGSTLPYAGSTLP